MRATRKRLHKWYWYEPKPLLFCSSVAVAIIYALSWLCELKTVRLILRVPTNNINSLVHDSYFLSERNKSAERSDHLAKLMKDSNYHPNLHKRIVDSSDNEN